MRPFCTLFDSNYLSRGLVMYHSLKKHCTGFHLYIFPFDDTTLTILKALNLEHVTVIPMKDFENEELMELKRTRTRGEYCWTCTPYIIRHCITTYSLSDCTYIDADLYFYSDPGVLLDEMGNKSVLITEHRYTPEYDQSATSGIYCVQFITFRNDEQGMHVLGWWKDRCQEWCFNRLEDGKFGDQKYLDDWTTRFESVRVLRHRGGGVAPWNVQQYKLREKQGAVWVTDTEPLVFYHFHWVKFLSNNKVDVGHYNLNFPLVGDLYDTYLSEIKRIESELKRASGFVTKPTADHGLKPFLVKWRRKLKGTYNVIDLTKTVFRGQAHRS